MQNYDFILNAANLVQLIQAAGRNVYYKTGTEAAGNAGVRVRGEGGGLDVVLLPGEGIQLPAGQSRFTLSKGDAAAGDIVGTFLIGGGQYFASRVQGDVSITNGAGLADAQLNAEVTRLLVGTDRAFMIGRGSTAVAGYAGAVRLRNPTGSGKVLIVKRLLMTRQTTNLSTAPYGFGWVAVTPGNAALYAPAESAPPDQAGVAGAGLVSEYTSATAADLGYNIEWLVPAGAAIAAYEHRGGPLVLRAGEMLTAGIIVATANEVFGHRFEWIERAA